jgi:hypothetical protein
MQILAIAVDSECKPISSTGVMQSGQLNAAKPTQQIHSIVDTLVDWI